MLRTENECLKVERTERERREEEVSEEVGRRRCGTENEDPPTESGGKNSEFLSFLKKVVLALEF